MYEIWSLGHKPFEGYTNQEVSNITRDHYTGDCVYVYTVPEAGDERP